MGLASLGGATARAVDWIRNLPANPAEGRITLEAEGMYAIIVRYAQNYFSARVLTAASGRLTNELQVASVWQRGAPAPDILCLITG